MRSSSLIYVTAALAFLALASAATAHAASLEYASLGPVDASTDSIVIQYGGLDSKDYYSCSFATFRCADLGSSPPPAPVIAPDPVYDLIPDGTPRLLREGASANDRFVYYVQYADADHPYRLYTLFDTATDKTYTEKDPIAYTDLLTEENRLMASSPDEKTLAYLDDRGGSPMIYFVDLAHLTSSTALAGTPMTTTKHYTVSDFMFIGNHTILFEANRDNPLTWSLYTYNTTTKLVTKVATDVSYDEPMEKLGTNVVFLQLIGGTEIPAVYDINTATVRSFALPETPSTVAEAFPSTIVHYGSTWGALLTPPKTSTATPHPLIIWLHGGPYRQTSAGIHPYLSYGVYDWTLEQARENGAIVLKLDYPGSYGYGTAFANALQGKSGVTDVNDVAAATAAVKQALKGKYSISGTYLVGNSYGGYLAVKSLTAHPATYAGAFSINGVTDWQSLLNDVISPVFNPMFGGAPSTINTALYSQADIVDNLFHLTPADKVAIVQAQDDTDIGTQQAVILDTHLKEAGIPDTYIPIDGEDHVFHKSSSITLICTSLLGFIDLAPNAPDRCDFQ